MSENRFRIDLFYSYCHTDEHFRERLEVALKPMSDNWPIRGWSDRKTKPGIPLKAQITEQLENSDVVVFLVSPDFLASDACREEWYIAKRNARETGQKLVPIIIRPCEWMEFDNMKEYLGLPKDGTPVSSWDNDDEAWLDVTRRLRTVFEEIRESLEVNAEFERKIRSVDFASKGAQGLDIDDLFVFPHLLLDGKTDRANVEKGVKSLEELRNLGLALIRGGVLSGKTTLCRKLFLYLVARKEPVLLIDLEEVGRKKPSTALLRSVHFGQFKGDYKLWDMQKDKTLILDNLSANTIEYIDFAKKHFKNIYVTTSEEDYLAYFADDRRVSDFQKTRLRPLTNAMQEDLIRKWKNRGTEELSGQLAVQDSEISQIEREVNSIFNNRIAPKFPFFVLSVLQTYAGFVPGNLSITAYGHCYQSLIVSHLSRSGIEERDVDDCILYLSKFAYALRQSADSSIEFTLQEYEEFLDTYGREYYGLERGILNRLIGLPNSVLASKNGHVRFSWPYSYYFFLGLYLSHHYDENSDLIESMVEKSYLKDNSLSLIFLIHHSNNTELLEKILIHTICTIDGRQPVCLNIDEIRVFEDSLQQLPSDIPTEKSVAEVRKEERNINDEFEAVDSEVIEESPHDLVNDIYKALKNMEILGQIVKNKSRSLERKWVFETVETVTDTALRLAGIFLFDSSELDDLAMMCRERLEEEAQGAAPSLEEIKDELGILVFVLIMSCIEKAVSAIDRKEIREAVKEVCEQKNTPAYDLIQCFYLIDIADSLSARHVDMAKKVLRKHRKNTLVSKALPIRIQMYMNSHRTSDSVQNAMRSQFRLLEDTRRTKGRMRT